MKRLTHYYLSVTFELHPLFCLRSEEGHIGKLTGKLNLPVFQNITGLQSQAHEEFQGQPHQRGMQLKGHTPRGPCAGSEAHGMARQPGEQLQAEADLCEAQLQATSRKEVLSFVGAVSWRPSSVVVEAARANS